MMLQLLLKKLQIDALITTKKVTYLCNTVRGRLVGATTLSIPTLGKMTFIKTIINQDTQHNGTCALMLSVVMLNVTYVEFLKYTLYTECHYAECRYAKCHGAD
jgi:hypothetical protein